MSTGILADRRYTYDGKAYRQSQVQTDAQGREFVNTPQGELIYVPPVGQRPEDGFFSYYTWNPHTGKWEESTDWAHIGAVASVAAVGGLSAAALMAPAAAGAGGASAGAGGYIGADVAATQATALGAGGAAAGVGAGAGGTAAATMGGGGAAAGGAGGAGAGLSWGTALRYGAPVAANAIQGYLNQRQSEGDRNERVREFDKTLAQRQAESAQQDRQNNQRTALEESNLDPWRGMMYQTRDAGEMERRMAGPRTYRPSASSPYSRYYNPGNEAPPLSPSYRTMLANAQRQIMGGQGQNASVLDQNAWGRPYGGPLLY